MEGNNIQTGDQLVDDKYLVLDTIDTNKDTLKIDQAPRKNSMQAMAVAEIKDEYKAEKRLEKVPGYPESVVKKTLQLCTQGQQINEIGKQTLVKFSWGQKRPKGLLIPL